MDCRVWYKDFLENPHVLSGLVPIPICFACMSKCVRDW